MATYNGEKFIEAQIDSLLNQTYQNWHLMVRDDGSIDQTVYILKTYKKQFPDKISILESKEHLGACLNFGELLKHSTADYVMFCDQDDIWLPEKIKVSFNGILHLEDKYGKEKPLLLFTDLTVVDKDLTVMAKSFWGYEKINPDNTTVNRLLVQNVVTGCTSIINKKLKSLSVPVPPEAIIHDWWIALVASVFGHTDYNSVPMVLYRQHGQNDVGARKRGLREALKKSITFETSINKIKELKYKTQIQALSFYRNYQSQPIEDAKKLSLVGMYSEMDKMSFFERKMFILNNKLLFGDLPRTFAEILFY
ncbi:MAG: glycosyltransferase family 2 protein [Candidatus Manganitrophus sp.]|nr:glycosyltransferase family 2 protein [Candidatus Manganitrophus sp.]MDC4223260.1 glycosyltransferase family 2 protein [Candidatus Manganitrophus sp.]WDT71638.1 MAG: glycosyltransferase family 2 protein [Candidatus Manganitrophus sp.]WDT76112.1 MAG: glycosyltransferase family 2 protein [Candidatus Manganitrophus sp.]WDT81014.1 MAG: glycosyltransferase family 2 protein [Candidatus Manganitrophus sp.]